MNKTILVGRTTKDMEVRMAGETPVVNFTVATNASKKDAPATFHNVVAFGKSATNLAKYAGKGSQILIEGHSQNRNYDNKEGQTVYVTEVVTERFEFLQTKTPAGQPEIEVKGEADPF